MRLIEEEDEESQYSESSVSWYYRMLISPVADLLEERELIVVPGRSLNQVPFSALVDEDGRYLSETCRIGIVPSLTTLKLIQDSPGNYHSQTGALMWRIQMLVRCVTKETTWPFLGYREQEVKQLRLLDC